MSLSPLLLLALALADPAPWPRSLVEAYPAPAGAQRVEVDAFGAWLRALRLADPAVPVRTWQGREVPGDFHVVILPLVPGDLQQCADSALRLRAEWLREAGQPVLFHATSGDPMPWERYRAGERAYDAGGRLAWRAGEPASWEQYLAALFTWAGTRSLARDTVAAAEPRPGEVLVLPGSPGHAVVLLDLAERGPERFVLVGQGYMPAQDFHLVRGPVAGWFRWELPLQVGPWTFPADSLRAWKG